MANRRRKPNNRKANRKRAKGQKRSQGKKRNTVNKLKKKKKSGKGTIKKIIGFLRGSNILIKKFYRLTFLVIIYLAPYLTLDLFRLPIVGHFTKYFIGLPAKKLGGFCFSLGDKIPILGFFIKQFAGTMWMYGMLYDLEIIGLEFILEEGLKKGLKKLSTIYSDEIIGLALAIPTAGIGGAIWNYATVPLDTEFWEFLDELGLVDKAIEHGPEFMAGIAATFLIDKHGSDSKQSSDTVAGQENGQAVAADGGQINRRSQNKVVTDGRGNNDRGSKRWGESQEGVYNNMSHQDDGGGGKVSGFFKGILGVFGKIFSGKTGKVVLGILGIGVIGLVGVATVGGGLGGFGVLLDDIAGSETTKTGNAAGSAAGGFTDLVGYKGSQLLKTAQCFGDAGCIREWRLNNTKRPGSKDVGETYELKVNGPTTFGNDGFDVAYEPPNANIPIFFVLRNTRHQLKGITAKNVKYRVRITDPQFGSRSKDQCKSDWISLAKYGSNSDNLNFGEKNANNWLLPGESAEPLNWQNEGGLTLSSCGLQQPSAGESYDVILEVKYDYSSQSTLTLNAMSSQHRNEQEISRKDKRSETADTPVETYINTRNPMVYKDLENGGTVPIPQQVRVGVTTDEKDIDYKIDEENFEVKDSSQTEHVSDSCQGLEQKAQDGHSRAQDLNQEVRTEDLGQGSNEYKLAKKVQERIDDQEENWFDKRSDAVQATCNFKLSNPEEISATGETLTMSADTSYTIRTSQFRSSFNIRNTRCRRMNCPLLKPIGSNSDLMNVLGFDMSESSPSSKTYMDKKYAKCDRPQDAQDGCSILKSGFSDRGDIVKFKENKIIAESDELAIETSALGNMRTCYVKNNPTEVPEYDGFEEDMIQEAYQGDNTLLNYSDGDWDEVDIDPSEEKAPSNGCIVPEES